MNPVTSKVNGPLTANQRGLIEMELRELIEEWYESITFMEEAAIRDPPSKHQRQIRYLQNKIKLLMMRVREHEGS